MCFIFLLPFLIIVDVVQWLMVTHILTDSNYSFSYDVVQGFHITLFNSWLVDCGESTHNYKCLHSLVVVLMQILIMGIFSIGAIFTHMFTRSHTSGHGALISLLFSLGIVHMFGNIHIHLVSLQP